jgi:AcrR family transcriptional regulator
MSSTTAGVPAEATTIAVPRRRLAGRPADTVDRLVEAAVGEVRATGYDGLTVRNVAARAGVAPATAYTYFASKDHLVAEVFWRRLRDLPPVRIDRRAGPATRAARAMREVALLVADEPELAAACTTALLAGDPEVKQLRDRIGAAIHARLTEALGPDADPAVVDALDLAWSGAMLQAGMGHLAYRDLPERFRSVAVLVTGGAR